MAQGRDLAHKCTVTAQTVHTTSVNTFIQDTVAVCAASLSSGDIMLKWMKLFLLAVRSVVMFTFDNVVFLECFSYRCVLY